MKNTFVKVLSFMMALTMIVGAFGAITVSAVAAECAHEDRTEIAVVAPTCAVAGFTRYECNDCGEEFIDSIKPATGKHSWKDVAETKATCDEDGYAAHKVCTVCEATDPKVLVVVEDALDHIWNIEYKQAATCTEDGFTSKKCARCGKVDDVLKEDGGNKEVSATDKAAHKYIYTVVTEPTKCSTGSIEVTCSACDYKATILREEDHEWVTMTKTTKFKADKDKACGYEYVSGKFCADCDTIHPDSVKNTDPVHDYVQVDFATITHTNLTAEIEALGYKVGDATDGTSVATCEVIGYYLGKCSNENCNKYAKVEYKVGTGKGHELEKVGSVYPTDDNAHHNVDKKQDWKCKYCTYTETTVVKAATPCVFTKEGSTRVHAPTCTANGYTEYLKCDLCNCDNCADDAHPNGEVKFATGHNYGAAVYKSGTCESADDVDEDGNPIEENVLKYVQICSNPGCPAKEIDAEIPKDADKCTWVKVTRAATCIADAYYEYECSVCKDTKAYDGTDKPAAGFDPNNHVVTSADQSQGTWVEKLANASCTNKQKDRYFCACNVLVEVETGATPAHSTKKVTIWHAADCTKAGTEEALASTCKAGCKDVSVVAATCQKTGYSKAGEICSVCGVITKDPVVENINKKNHEKDTEAEGAKVLSYDKANCASAEYTSTYYPCCGIVDTIYTGDKDATNHLKFKGQASEATMIKKVAEVPATCIANGTGEHYKCEGCGKLFAVKDDGSVGDAINAAPVLKNGGDNKNDFKHDWNTDPETTGVKAETCTEDGTKAYYTCKAAGCSAIKIKESGKIIDARADKTTDSDPLNKQYPDLKIPAHGTANMGWHKGVDATCTEAGYWFKDSEGHYSFDSKYCCSVCDKQTIAPKNHPNADSDTKNDPAGEDYDCTKDTFVIKFCPDCKTSFFESFTKTEKTAHVFEKYTEGDKKGQDKPSVPGTPTCTKAAEDVYKCQNPNCDYKETRPGAAATGHKIDVNGVKISVDFGCTSADHVTYKGFKCVCGLELGKDSEHNIVTAKEKAPTCTTTGNTEFDYCVDCGKIVAGTVTEIPATGHRNYDLVEVVDGVAKYSCQDCGEFFTEDVVVLETTLSLENTLVAAGSEIKVAINATADALAFNQLCIEVYGATKIVDVELVYDFGAATHVDFTDYEFYIYTEHDVNGDPTFVTLDGEDVALAIVTLKVDDLLYGSEFEIEAGAYWAVVDFDEDGEVYADVIDEYDYVEVQGVMAGELNGDGFIGVSDIQKLMNLVANGSTDAIADVNRDGVVDVFDIAALRTFNSSNGSAYAYFTMMGADFAALAKKYAPDMNNDGYINDTDAKLFATYLEKNLADYDAYYMYVYEAMYDLAFASRGEVVLQGAADLVEFVSDYISENGEAPAISAIFDEVIEEYYEDYWM